MGQPAGPLASVLFGDARADAAAKDVLAELWDHGVGAVSAAGLTDPYEANVLSLAAALASQFHYLFGIPPKLASANFITMTSVTIALARKN